MEEDKIVGGHSGNTGLRLPCPSAARNHGRTNFGNSPRAILATVAVDNPVRAAMALWDNSRRALVARIMLRISARVSLVRRPLPGPW